MKTTPFVWFHVLLFTSLELFAATNNETGNWMLVEPAQLQNALDTKDLKILTCAPTTNI